MSVWDTPSHRIALARHIYESCGPLQAERLLPNAKDYIALSKTESNLADCHTWDDVATELEWDREGVPFARYTDQRVLIGTAAVHRLIAATFSGKMRAAESVDRTTVNAAVMSALDYVWPSTQISPRALIRLKARFKRDGVEEPDRIEDVARALLDLRHAHGKDRDYEIYVSKVFGGEWPIYVPHACGKVIMWVGCGEYAQQLLITARVHLDYLVGSLLRIANYQRYAMRCGDTAALTTLTEVVDTCRKSNNVTSCLVARAWHKVRAGAQMVLLKTQIPGAVEHEEADFYKDGLAAVIEWEHHVVMARRIARRLSSAHAYKCLPPPDYDTLADFAAYKAYHNNPRPSGADSGATDAAREAWRAVVAERNYNFLTAYYKLNQAYPPGVPVGTERLTYAIARDWVPTLCTPYNTYGNDVSGAINDKAIVPDDAEAYARDRAGNSDRSYLLWYLENASSVDTVADLTKFAAGQLGVDNYVGVARKAESHKNVARLFYIAPARHRLLLAELEANISRIAEVYPGSLQGKSSAAKDQILGEVMDTRRAAGKVMREDPVIPFTVTFDLTKFSPRSNWNVTADYCNFWADVYGNPEIRKLGDIGCRSEIVDTADGVYQSYTNPGADLEGFRGRMQTLFHADMLGAACRLASSRGYIQAPSALATFIDDGACKIAAITNDDYDIDIAIENARGFLGCMEEIYAACGQEANQQKTLVSRVGGEMLASLYVDGHRRECAVKAYCRVIPTYDNPASSIADDLDQIYSNVQGAVKDQCDWGLAYVTYLTKCVETIARWDSDGLQCVSMRKFVNGLFTPKSFGGYGLSGMAGLVSTVVQNATCEGLAIMNRACRSDPTWNPIVLPVVNRPVVQREPLAILREPLRVRTQTKCIVEGRLTRATLKVLSEGGTHASQYLTGVNVTAVVGIAKAVAHALLSDSRVSVPELQHFWRVTQLYYIETLIGKFKRARTILRMIGSDEVNNIRRANRADVREINRSFY